MNNEWNVNFHQNSLPASFILVEGSQKLLFWFSVKLRYHVSFNILHAFKCYLSDFFFQESHREDGMMTMEGAALAQSCVLPKTAYQRIETADSRVSGIVYISFRQLQTSREV